MWCAIYPIIGHFHCFLEVAYNFLAIMPWVPVLVIMSWVSCIGDSVHSVHYHYIVGIAWWRSLSAKYSCIAKQAISTLWNLIPHPFSTHNQVWEHAPRDITAITTSKWDAKGVGQHWNRRCREVTRFPVTRGKDGGYEIIWCMIPCCLTWGLIGQFCCKTPVNQPLQQVGMEPTVRSQLVWNA